MSGPFRELFVELPSALFEVLQAIGEEAARRSGGIDASYMFKRTYGPRTYGANPWLTDFAARALASRYGFRRIEMSRSAANVEVYGRAIQGCGHEARFWVDELALHLDLSSALEAIDRAVELAGRGCYCVERTEDTAT